MTIGIPMNPKSISANAKLFIVLSRYRKGPLFLLLRVVKSTNPFPAVAINPANTQNAVPTQKNVEVLS